MVKVDGAVDHCDEIVIGESSSGEMRRSAIGERTDIVFGRGRMNVRHATQL